MITSDVVHLHSMAELPTSATTYTPADMAHAMGVSESGTDGHGWMGALLPLAPMAPPEVAGRQLDYQFGYNKLIQPKVGDGASVSFPQLRALSESWDVLRAVIESRKDRGSTVPLKFRDRDWKPGAKPSASAVAAEKLFRKPDGNLTLTAWRRMIREDLYVVDAPTVFVARSGARVIGFEILDGATIKPLSDDWGRRPKEGPAYQQTLKGMPALHYPASDIIYSPRNPRPHKFYGYSPVEQAVLTIETGIRRQLGQLAHFTAGNIPEMFISCPDTWNPVQVKEMQEFWDALLSGNIKGKAGARFIPGGMKPEQYKGDAVLKNEFDEWIARVICYFFSVSPQPFVREMNRATAEVAQAVASSEGVISELAWEKDLFDEMLSRAGLDSVEAVHDTNTDPDPKTKSDIVVAQFAAGLIKKSFAVEKLGYPAEAEAEDPPAPVAVAPGVKGNEPTPKPPDAGKTDCGHDHAAKADDLPPMDTEAGMVDAVAKLQAEMLPNADAIAQALYSGAKVPELIISKRGLKAFFVSARLELGAAAVAELPTAKAKTLSDLDPVQLVAPAKAWAEQRAAWLVGMRVEGGKLVPNPNAAYRITDEAREAIRSSVAKAFEEGHTSAQLSQTLSESQAFAPRRALMIARTEVAEAQEAGSMAYYKAAGVPLKKWSGAVNCCPLCQTNQAAGVISLESEFPSGHQHAPAHPNDRCRVVPAYEALDAG